MAMTEEDLFLGPDSRTSEIDAFLDAPVTQAKEKNPLRFAANSFNKGWAEGVDSLLNLPNDVVNAGIYGANKIGEFAGVNGKIPYIPHARPTEFAFRKINAINDRLAPETDREKLVDSAIRGASSAFTFPGSSVKNAVANAFQGGSANLAGEAVTQATGNPYIGMVANLGVGFGGPAVTSVGQMPTRYADAGRRGIVADEILNWANNPENLGLRLEHFKPELEGQKYTLSQALEDPGLAAKQRTFQSLPVHLYGGSDENRITANQAFQDLESNQRARQAAAMNEIAPGEQGAQKFQAGIQAKVKARIDAATAQMQDRLSRMGSDITNERAGSAIGTAYDANRAAMREKEKFVWSLVDPENKTGIPVPYEEAQKIADQYFGPGSGGPPKELSGLLGELKTMATPEEQLAAIPQNVRPKKGPVDPAVDPLHIAVRKMGGLNIGEGGGELGWMRESNIGKPSPTFGPLARKNAGDSFDGMAERLHQFGYLDEPTANALMNALEDEARGTVVLSHAASPATLDYHFNPRLETGTPPPDYSNQVPLRHIQNARSWASEIERNAGGLLSPDRRVQAAAGRIGGLLDSTVDDAAKMDTGELANAPYFSARDMTRQRIETFDKGPGAKMLTEGGKRRTEDAKIPGLFLNGSPEAARQFAQVVGDNPDAIKAARDYVATEAKARMLAPNGELKSNWENALGGLLNEKRAVIERFPGLLQDINSAKYATKATEKAKSLLTEGGTAHFNKALDAENAVKRFLASPNKREDTQDILNLIGNDPEMKGHLAAAIKDQLLNKTMQNGMSDINGNQIFSRGAAHKFLVDPSNVEMMTKVFGEDAVKDWSKVAKDLERTTFNQRANNVVGSNTHLNAYNSPIKTGAAWLGNLLSHVPVVGPAVGMGRSLAKSAQANIDAELDGIRARALLDPEFTKELLKDATPERQTRILDWLKDNAPMPVLNALRESQAF